MKNGHCLTLFICMKCLPGFLVPLHPAHWQGGGGNYLYLDYLLIT